MADTIVLHESGAIPLFYRAITGVPATSYYFAFPRRIRLSKIYPYILEIGFEYTMATGRDQIPLRRVNIEPVEERGLWRLKCTLIDDPTVLLPPHATDRNYVPILHGLRRQPGTPAYVGRGVRSGGTDPPLTDLRERFRSFLIYTPTNYRSREEHLRREFPIPFTPVSTMARDPLLMFQELPILLAFFHMGSVVRYDPEFHGRLMDSKYWPLLLALQRHGTCSFLRLFWSFVNQQSIYLRP